MSYDENKLLDKISIEEALEDQAARESFKFYKHTTKDDQISKIHPNSGVVKTETVSKFQQLVKKNQTYSPPRSLLSDSLSLILLILASLASLVLISEVKLRVSEESLRLTVEIQECTRQYTMNRCEDKVPLTQVQCLEWEKCMMRNPGAVFYSEIVTSMVASVIRSFFEHLHLNTFGMIAVGVVFLYLLKFK